MGKRRFRSILCTMVSQEAAEKLEALMEMFGTDIEPDFAGHVLEIGIVEAWEMYRRNPKHSKQISEWEAAHKPGSLQHVRK